MMGMFGAKERTVDEMKQLMLSAGWKVTEIRRASGSVWAYTTAVPIRMSVGLRVRYGQRLGVLTILTQHCSDTTWSVTWSVSSTALWIPCRESPQHDFRGSALFVLSMGYCRSIGRVEKDYTFLDVRLLVN